MIQSAMQPSTAAKKMQNKNCVLFVSIKIYWNCLHVLKKGNKLLIDYLHGNSRTPVIFPCMGIDFTMSLIGQWRATNSNLYFLGLALNRNSLISSVVLCVSPWKNWKKSYWHKMHVAILSLTRLKIVLQFTPFLSLFFANSTFFPFPSFIYDLIWLLGRFKCTVTKRSFRAREDPNYG